MQTPISFALDILLDCDTIEKAHKMARRYIKVLEACGSPPAMRNAPTAAVHAQAPSTQRLLNQHAMTQSPAAPIAPPLLNRVVGAEINNGDGTKGKRKW